MSIWNFPTIRKTINTDSYITLGEGGTPLEKITYGEDTLLLKREDKNPTGSWKDRGTAYKLTQLLNQGVSEVVISSTGNAAISLLTYANTLPNFVAHVVISPDANPEKKKLLQELAGTRHEVIEAKHPKRESSRIAAQRKIPVLRASTDDALVRGYWSLGYELASEIKHNQLQEHMLFCAVSSGTTLIGLLQGLLEKLGSEMLMPKVAIVQTSSCYPVVQAISDELPEIPQERSLADSIANQSVLRLPQLQHSIKQTDGLGYIITNENLQSTKNTFINKSYIENNITNTSLLSLAGYLQWRRDYPKHTGIRAIAVLSGR